MDHYTLADLLGHWDQGELTLEEVLARWLHDGVSRDELLRDIVRVLAVHQSRLAVLEGRVILRPRAEG